MMNNIIIQIIQYTNQTPDSDKNTDEINKETDE